MIADKTRFRSVVPHELLLLLSLLHARQNLLGHRFLSGFYGLRVVRLINAFQDINVDRTLLAVNLQIIEQEIGIVSKPRRGPHLVSIEFLACVPHILLFWRNRNVDQVGRDAAKYFGGFVIADPVPSQTIRFRIANRSTEDLLCLGLGDQYARIGQCRLRIGCSGA